MFSGNLLAGVLAERTVAMGLGPVGCFGMGFVATALASVLLLVFTTYGSLADPEQIAGVQVSSPPAAA